MTYKRGKQSLAFIFLLVVVLSAAFVSAGFFSDLWNKITGSEPQFSPFTCENTGTKADVNRDGQVNLIDMSFVKSKDGCSPISDYENCGRFDINGDGNVNLIDMALVKSLDGCVPLPSCQDFGYQYGNVSCCDSTCQDYNLSNCRNETRTCTNNDAGPNEYFTFSNVSAGVFFINGPSCPGEPGSGGGGGGGMALDSCSDGNLLKERVCNPDKTIGTLNISCSSLGDYSCQSGACISNQTNQTTPPECSHNYECTSYCDGLPNCNATCDLNIGGGTCFACSDSDGGFYEFIPGKVVERLINLTQIDEDLCYTWSGGNFAENYCEGSRRRYSWITCENGCVDEVGGDYCIPTNQTACSETDGGKNYLTKGTASNATTTKVDTCYSSFYLTEYYCNPNVAIIFNETTVSCATQFGSGYICQDGACISNQTNSTLKATTQTAVSDDVCIRADVNLDGQTNLIDMSLVKSLNGCTLTNDEVCQRADVNLDGQTNLIDMSLVKSLNG